MDPFAFTGSLLTVLAATKTIATASMNLSLGLSSAQKEIQLVSSQILRKQSQLALVAKVYEIHRSLLSPGGETAVVLQTENLILLKSSLKRAEECLEEIEKIIRADKRKEHTERVEDTTSAREFGKSVRLKWVLRDKASVMQLFDILNDVENGLSMMLTATSVFLSSASYASILDIASKQDYVIRRICENALKQGPLFVWSETQGLVNHASIPRIWPSMSSKDHEVNRQIHSSIALNGHWNQMHSTYSFSCLLRLPFLLTNYVIAMAASIQFFYAGWPKLSHSLTFKNIVPSDSRFMKACDNGDIRLVRELMTAGKGRATDIDEFGVPVLHRAIQSQSASLVRFLLDSGASANTLDESCHGSSLALACRYGLLDIGRILLARGACVEHVDAGGGTALANLWQNPNLLFSRVEFGRALLAASSPPINPGQGDFVNPLNCAALKGSGEDIDFLISLGANISSQDCYGDYAIKYCIWGSNTSTYNCVEPFMPLDWVNQRDSRGRTPLHMALEYPGSDTTEICKRILKAGADIHALDNENNSPQTIAALTDERFKGIHLRKIGTCRNFESYVQALRYCGHDVETRGSGDIFWIADEYSEYGHHISEE